MEKMIAVRLGKADMALIQRAAKIRRSDVSALVREATVRLAEAIIEEEKRRRAG